MAITKEEIIDAVGSMSVMDLNDLVKAFEEKFGVSAAAMAVAGPAGAAASATGVGAPAAFCAATAPNTRAIADTGAFMTPNNVDNNSSRLGIVASALTPATSNNLPLYRPALITSKS